MEGRFASDFLFVLNAVRLLFLLQTSLPKPQLHLNNFNRFLENISSFYKILLFSLEVINCFRCVVVSTPCVCALLFALLCVTELFRSIGWPPLRPPPSCRSSRPPLPQQRGLSRTRRGAAGRREQPPPPSRQRAAQRRPCPLRRCPTRRRAPPR